MLRRFLDRIHPAFDRKGKLERLYPLYEALDTFLYTPGEVTRADSHVRDSLDLKRLMSMVIVALVPCIFMAFWNTGYQANLAMQHAGIEAASGWRGMVMSSLQLGYAPNNFLSCLVHGGLYFLPVYIVTMAVGGTWELVFSLVRRHDINEGFLVTGMLFPLTLPPTIPLWQVALGISFGIVIGKEVFGGTGKNFLNPALTARAFLYFAYPAQISGDAVWVAVDGYTSATSLGRMAVADPATGLQALLSPEAQQVPITWMQAFLGTIAGSMGETSALACLIGALILIATGIGSWRIMAAVLVGGMGFSAVLYYLGSETNPVFNVPPWWHLVLGGYAFGLVFMATDPVSAAMTDTGKWVYGILIGAMTILIRVINPAFPEGIMLAILFGNVFAPTIDYFVIQANVKRRLARYAT
ncbi:MAG: NADH:ubiquinone reductase (Na(+)-transporting) subunit B [Pirellulaceae bacterium]|nr:NADH:ubiquinone reductase (Na(+)-transporting) subunit B [Pirellulaceae bacterium]